MSKFEARYEGFSCLLPKYGRSNVSVASASYTDRQFVQTFESKAAGCVLDIHTQHYKLTEQLQYSGFKSDFLIKTETCEKFPASKMNMIRNFPTAFKVIFTQL